MDEQNFRIKISKQSGCRAGLLLSRIGIDYYRAGTQIQVYRFFCLKRNFPWEILQHKLTPCVFFFFEPHKAVVFPRNCP